ncbi:MAG TPA: thioesterase family protein [Nitrososphaerales archaeon]|nr:thioesterase family protein [Nitrososphaerales archaeon]
MGSWHEQKLRVRYEETDTMGVVYYGKFFVWMEVGRVSLLRDIGFGYKEWVKHKLEFPVVQAHLDYKASARFDDEVLVKTRIASVGNSSIRFENEICMLPEMKLLAAGHTVHVLTDTRGAKVPFSAELRSRLTSS